MKLYEFDKYFPNEESCKAKFKEIRDREGITCPKCSCTKHYWKTSKEMYQCAKCGHRQSLKANTIMYNSKLPFRYWFIAMHMLTATKLSFSSAELQRQLGHKSYQPIWEMCHKIRSVMGKRDDKYTVCGNIEFDEGFFTTYIPEDQKNEKLKAGAGSQRKTKVAVMAETEEPEISKKGQKPTKVSYIKMVVVENLKSETISAVAESNIESESSLITDDSTSHTKFKSFFNEHRSQVIDPKDIGKVLPWVHIAIGNAKSLLTATHKGIKPEYLQGYLNEFCYKFNRRYFGDRMFDRLVMIGATYTTDFTHKVYNKNAA
jgi:transposase-like protein/DNA-directed RNA polymerase subunit RPC12/RpoP